MKYEQYSYRDLQTIAKNKGLKASGTKAEIINRLRAQRRRRSRSRQRPTSSCRPMKKRECTPPCTWRKRVGCVYQKGKKGSPLTLSPSRSSSMPPYTLRSPSRSSPSRSSPFQPPREVSFDPNLTRLI
jgi:hypothetical protein